MFYAKKKFSFLENLRLFFMGLEKETEFEFALQQLDPTSPPDSLFAWNDWNLSPTPIAMIPYQESVSVVEATPISRNQETGSKKPTNSTADLFDPALFIVDESAIKNRGVLDSPPRIGFASDSYSWAESVDSESNRKDSEPKWSLVFDALTSSDFSARKSDEVDLDASSWAKKGTCNKCNEVGSRPPIQ